jgi:hypothetical protein
MIDFVESFKIGIDNAEQANENSKEIADVFDKLNSQLGNATHKKLNIKRQELPMPGNLFSSLNSPPLTYFAIVAENPKSAISQTRELAKWHEARTGYPCKITFGNNELHCEDKTALEYGLSELLRDPVIGGILHKLTLE